MPFILCNKQAGILKLGGVQRFIRELDRCSAKYSELFEGNNRATLERNRTIFEEIRKGPSINESRLLALKMLTPIYLYFNQNKFLITKDEFNNMQADEILSIYELLLEQNLRKKRQMEAI